MKARYIRVSSLTQNNARQLAKAHPDERLFIDVCSGAIPFADREQGKVLLSAVQAKEIDFITVSSVDRLGRNSFDIQHTLNWLTEQGVTVKIENLGNLESLVNGKANPIFKMITDVLANVSSMEREAIRERQAEGIAIAKAQGKFSGKRNKPSASDADILQKYKSVVKELKSSKNSLRNIAKLCDVSLGTVQKVKAAMDRQKEKGIS
ncbi:recombinase family protein [Flavobacterium sedimenticola]|uniref:Recombinase family protein n=1 Tax=Flavobacterium sedimenticola TaxID=3043286 RepID=A0ABT6XQA4_9FLAO|nr:recombinase family protein [Flavobacterium sedimenticola]MDI9257270.1 recombinase family protein [Flavobacterium sedimenticola]